MEKGLTDFEIGLLDRLKFILDEMRDKGLKISVAESCTGGYVSHMITNVPGASDIFERGVITYSNKSKIHILGIDSSLIDKFGTVSNVVAKQMAEGVRRISDTDIGIGVTGIAGPSGGTENKPVGLVYVSFSVRGQLIQEKYEFHSNRIGFKRMVLEAIITKLEDIVSPL